MIVSKSSKIGSVALPNSPLLSRGRRPCSQVEITHTPRSTPHLINSSSSMHTVLSSVPLTSHSHVKSNVRNCTCRSKHTEDAPATSSGSSSSTHGAATSRNHFPQLSSEKPQRQNQRLDQPAPQNPQSAVPQRRHQQRHPGDIQDAKVELKKTHTPSAPVQRASGMRLTHLLVTCPSQLEMQLLLKRNPSQLNGLHVAAALHRLCKLASLESSVTAATEEQGDKHSSSSRGTRVNSDALGNDESRNDAHLSDQQQQQQEQARPHSGGLEGVPWWLTRPREPKTSSRNRYRRSSIGNLQASSGTSNAWWETASLASAANGFRSGSAWDPTRSSRDDAAAAASALDRELDDGSMWEDDAEEGGEEDDEQDWQGGSSNSSSSPQAPASSSQAALPTPPSSSPSSHHHHHSSTGSSLPSSLQAPAPQTLRRQGHTLSPYQASLALTKQVSESLFVRLPAVIENLDGRGIASVIASLARLNFAEPTLLQQLVSASTPLLHTCSARHLATLVWGLAALKHIPPQEWCVAFLAASQPLLATAHPASLATICYRFGSFGHRPEDTWLAAACNAATTMRPEHAHHNDTASSHSTQERSSPAADSSSESSQRSSQMVHLQPPTSSNDTSNSSSASADGDAIDGSFTASHSSSSSSSMGSSASGSSSTSTSETVGLTSFTGQQLSDLLSGLSLMRHLPEDTWMQAYFATSGPLLSRYGARHLGRSLSALASLGCRPDDTWMEAFYLAWQPVLASLTGARLSSLMASLAKLNCRPSGDWMNEVLKRSKKAVARSSLLQLTELLTGLAGLRFKASEAWMTQLYGALFRKLPFFSPVQHVEVVAALSRLRHRPPAVWLTHLTAAQLPLLPLLDGEQLSTLVGGLTSMKAVPSQAWLLAFETQSNAKLSSVSPVGLSAVATALATLRYQPSISWLYAFVLSSYAQLDTFDAAQLAAVFGSLPSISPYPTWVDELIQVCASERYTRPKKSRRRQRSSASSQELQNGSSSGIGSSDGVGDDDYGSSSSSSSDEDNPDRGTTNEPKDWTQNPDGTYTQPVPGFSSLGSRRKEFQETAGTKSSGSGLFASTMTGGGCISIDSMDYVDSGPDADTGPSASALLSQPSSDTRPSAPDSVAQSREATSAARNNGAPVGISPRNGSGTLMRGGGVGAVGIVDRLDTQARQIKVQMLDDLSAGGVPRVQKL